jgi:hypothetical protein
MSSSLNRHFRGENLVQGSSPEWTNERTISTDKLKRVAISFTVKDGVLAG